MARDRDEVSVVIGDQEWRRWNSITVERHIDAFSTVQLSAPFEPDRSDFRETFRPFTFKPMKVLVGGDVLFTGTLVDVFPKLTKDSRTVEVAGYALPGVLQDCCAPASAVPYEWQGAGLRAIADALLSPFGLEVESGAETAIFEKIALEPDGTILQFLIDLAKQRKLVINDTVEGKVRFWASVATGSPVARLEEGIAPCPPVAPSFSPTQFFSEVTAFAGAKTGQEGSKSTAHNVWLLDLLRPHNFTVDDTDPGDAPDAAAAKLGRMFGEMASFTLEPMPTWRDPQGDLFEPNTTLTLKAPGAMIYRETELLIRSVLDKAESSGSRTSSLELVLPGAYSGEMPEALPWNG